MKTLLFVFLMQMMSIRAADVTPTDTYQTYDPSNLVDEGVKVEDAAQDETVNGEGQKDDEEGGEKDDEEDEEDDEDEDEEDGEEDDEEDDDESEGEEGTRRNPEDLDASQVASLLELDENATA